MSNARPRAEIDTAHKWDTESVYSDPEKWEQDFGKIDDLIRPIQEFQGKLNNADAIAAVFRIEDEAGEFLDRLYLYAHMKEDEDTSIGVNQDRMSRLRAKYARIGGELAWVDPEILSHPEKDLRAWMEADVLKPYRRSMEKLLRRKPHTLSKEEETLLGLAADVLGTPYEAFSKLTNADLKFDDAVDSKGDKHTVTNGTAYSLYMKRDRALRESTFGSLYKGYGDHLNTIATLLGGSTKHDVFKASIRKHSSSLEASLFSDNIPTSVYHSLISSVREALPIYHEYVELRARALKLGGDINMWDFYVPMVPDFDMEVEWDECRKWIEKSLEPLGSEYMEGARSSFTERWYDVFENKGKRSGAYSTGAYGQKPFMLLNYHRTLNDVFTVAHELGHSMHSFFSQKYQPYRYAGYPIFLAEIASTTNEALLHHHLIQTKDDPRLRAYLLNHLCDSYKGTVFRQTMFAEFELKIHERLEEGNALTADWMKEYYYQLNADYYGPSFKADERISWEWSRIPHFYYNFYVYKYATGFAAAQIFSQRVLESGESRDKYLGFLKSGGSMDPLDTVKAAGVDLSDPKVMCDGFENFRSAVKELSQLLDAIS
ncbi:MAG: oligoendopeptidase F [Candidatus Sumerlaeia bacterium]|nr:oligoendopeptidase F [Candidatus Sumerlaeia bacterium]